MDLSTGKSLGQVMTPTLLRPSLVVSGGHAMMINGQRYSLIDTLTMTAVSHNLNLPGASAAAMVSQGPLSTTFVIVGSIGATAVVIHQVNELPTVPLPLALHLCRVMIG